MKSLMRSYGAAAALLVLTGLLPQGASALDADAITAQVAAMVPGYEMPAPPPDAFGILSTRRKPKPKPVPAPYPVPSDPGSATGGGQFFAEPDAGRGPVLDVINGAQQTITLTIYEINDSQIVDALVSAAQRGVAVRVIYNLNSFRGKDPNGPTISQLESAGVQAKAASDAFTVTHQKTLVADGRTAVIMSFNLQASYFSTSRDFGYVTSDQGMVSEIAQVFEDDWNGTEAAPSQPALVWSPENSRSKITEVIEGARQSLDIYNEELEDASILSAISAAAQRGVQVRVLCPKLGSGATDGNAKGRSEINNAGGQAKIGAGLYIHGKAVLADYGTSSAEAYMGSENFSVTSLDKNRELGVLLNDSSALSTIENAFQSDWGQ